MMRWDDRWDAEPRGRGRGAADAEPRSVNHGVNHFEEFVNHLENPEKFVLAPRKCFHKPWKLVTLPVNHLKVKVFGALR
jgi:hypothetical protein